MHLQLAFRKADLKVGLDGLRLLLRPAVYQPVIRIPTPWKLRVRPRHPEIERIVQEEICQYWADDTTLRCSTRSFHPRTILQDHRCRQPSFNVQDCPLALDVFLDSPRQERVVDVVEQAFDIELEYPILFPAALPRRSNGIERRFSGPITIGVWQECRVQVRLDDHLDNHLRHTIRYGWHSQDPLPSILLRNGNSADRRWKVASRAHPVPDLVEVVSQVGIELLDRLSIHPGRPGIGLDRFVGFVDQFLVDTERLVCRIHRVLLSPVVLRMQPPDPIPLLRPHYSAFVAPTDRSAPVLRIGTLASWLSPLVLLPWHRSDWFPQFRTRAGVGFTPPLRRSPPAQSSGSRQACPGRWCPSRF